LFPDMKKKNAVRNSIEPIFGRGGGGAMNVPGGIGVGGARPPGAVRGERGDVGGPGGSPAGAGGVGSDIVPCVVCV
jgi:hypothetical protein